MKYGRRYRFVDDEGSELEPWTQDMAIEKFSDEQAKRLNQRIREALEADGYTVRND